MDKMSAPAGWNIILIQSIIKLMRTILTIFLFLFIACKDNESLYLKLKIDSKNNEISDTLGYWPQHKILLSEGREYGFLGEFSTNYLFIKEKSNERLIYKVENISNKIDIVVSKDYFAFVEPYADYKNYGWFFLEKGKAGKLPFLDNFMDSLKSVYSSYFIKEINGYIELYQNGKIEKTLNYGNFFLKDKNLDSLEYGLYKIGTNRITLLSENGNELNKQQDGLFFVPSPGYGVIAKYAIKDIIQTIDSISNLENPPKNIRIKMN